MSKEELECVKEAIKTGDRFILLRGIPTAIKGYEIARQQRVKEIEWYDAILRSLRTAFRILQREANQT